MSKLWHNPSDNAGVAPASVVGEAIDVALIGSDLYMTDCQVGRPRLLVIDVARITRRFTQAEVLAEVAAEATAGEPVASDDEDNADGRGDSSSHVSRVSLGGGGPLIEPFGICSDPLRSELFISDRAGKCIYIATLATRTEAVLHRLQSFTSKPTAIALNLEEPRALAVAVGDRIYLLSPDRPRVFSMELALHIPNAFFCGVAFAPAALHGDLYLVERTKNAVMVLPRQSSSRVSSSRESSSSEWSSPSESEEDDELPLWLRFAPERLYCVAGGNSHAPAGVWYEGTASHVELWKPTMGVFAHNCFIFSNGGQGGLGKVLMLTDAYVLADIAMPALRAGDDAYCVSADPSCHATNRIEGLAKLREVAAFLTHVANGVEAVCGSRVREGPSSNFSRDAVLGASMLIEIFEASEAELARLGVPDTVRAAMTMTSTVTLMVEHFFSVMRQTHPNPSVLQFGQNHATAMFLERFRQLGSSFFSYWTGRQRKQNQHYRKGFGEQAKVVYPEKSFEGKHSRDSRSPTNAHDAARQHALRPLRVLAATYPPVSQGKVTDRKKEAIGAKPTRFWDPRPLQTQQRSDSSEGEEQSSLGAPSRPVVQSNLRVLYHAMQLVVIKPDRTSGVWYGMLMDPVVQRTASLLNVDRPRVLYYVDTSELREWPAALEFWARMAAATVGGVYTSDPARWEAEAGAKADDLAASVGDGVHLSYAGEVRVRGHDVTAFDRVSVEAIYGALDGYHMREVREIGSQQCVTRLAISAKAHEHALALVQTRGKSAPCVESDESSDDGDGSEEEAPVRATVALRHGRCVSRRNYKE